MCYDVHEISLILIVGFIPYLMHVVIDRISCFSFSAMLYHYYFGELTLTPRHRREARFVVSVISPKDYQLL